MDKDVVHHQFSRADLGRGDACARTVAPLGRGFDGWEVLLVVVAVSQEEQMRQPGTPLQVDGVAAKEFAGHADKGDLIIKQSHAEMRAHSLLVFPFVEVNDAFEKGSDKT